MALPKVNLSVDMRISNEEGKKGEWDSRMREGGGGRYIRK